MGNVILNSCNFCNTFFFVWFFWFSFVEGDGELLERELWGSEGEEFVGGGASEMEEALLDCQES